MFSKLCTEAMSANLPLPQDVNAGHAKDKFVINGFSNWSQGKREFKNHKKSPLHWDAVTGLNQLESGVKVINSHFKQKLNQMKEARVALEKFFNMALLLGMCF